MASESLLDEVIVAVENCTVRRDYDLLFLILNELDLGEHDLIAMYYFCVELLAKTGDDRAVPLMSDYFARASGYGSVVQFLLFARYPDKTNTLEFFYNTNQLSFPNYLVFFVQLPDEEDMRKGFAVLLEILASSSELELEAFREALQLSENGEIPLPLVARELLTEQITLRQKSKERPVYILEGEALSTQKEMLERFIPPQPKQYENRRQQLNEACLFYANQLYESGDISRPEISTNAAQMQEKLTDMTKLMDFIAGYDKDQSQLALQKDTELFRILGPCHPVRGMWDLDSEGSYVCQRHGGCRMLTCVCHEDEDDDTGLRFEQPELFDWFTGSCDFCLRPIEERHYAFRILNEEGGMSGCGHPECIIENLCPHSISYTLTKKALYELQSTGLYDRREPEVLEETPEETLASVADFMEFLRTDTEPFEF